MLVAVRRHGVEVSCYQESVGATERGTRDDVVTDPGDLEVVGAAQRRGHKGGGSALVMADRRDVDELCRQLKQACTRGAHADAPCSRRMSFSVALSWRSPGVR